MKLLSKVVGVQTAKTTSMMIDGKRVMTAIRKTAVSGAAAVAPLGLVGDEQANPDVHGGLSKAVYAYPSEHYEFWRKARLDRGLGLMAGMEEDALPFGFMGENLTLAGVLESDVWVGDVLEFANCTLRITDPREPCFKFNATMGFNTAAKAMAQSGFCGFYLAVDKQGTIAAGETFRLIAGSRQMSIPSRFAVKMRRQ